VWQTASNFDASRGKPIAWLLTICRSRALDHLRRRDPAETHAEPETLVGDRQTGGDDPQDLLLACERNRRLHSALERLTPTQRQLIALAFFRGLTHQEIAASARMPLGTVKTDIRRALTTLRESLQGDHER
jgi:RNA polymerase sigma-70 factor (ECF subfamily)